MCLTETGGSLPGRRFHVAGPDADGRGFLTPVVVRCARCEEESPHFGTAGGDDPREFGLAWLEQLSAWAKEHKCGPSLSPDAWLKAAAAVQAQALEGQVPPMDPNTALKAFTAGLRAVWDEVTEAARRQAEQGG